MWRRVLALVHPDRGGSHDAFIFLQGVREAVLNGPECHRCALPPGDPGPTPTGPGRSPEQERIPYDPVYANADLFVDLTTRSLSLAQEVGEPYRAVPLGRLPRTRVRAGHVTPVQGG
jgi:hypothetical protein